MNWFLREKSAPISGKKAGADAEACDSAAHPATFEGTKPKKPLTFHSVSPLNTTQGKKTRAPLSGP